MDKKTIKRNEILKASIDLMYLKGYNGTSVKDITDAAGIPKGSFYNYFSDKEEYALYAIRYFDEFMTTNFALTAKNKELAPLDRIKSIFKSGIESAKKSGLNYGCFVGNITQEMGNVCESISKEARDFDKVKEELIYANLVEAFNSGELKKETDLKVLSNAIITSWQGAQLRMKMNKNVEALDDFYITLCEVFLK